MKKTYIQPRINAVSLHHGQSLLTVSGVTTTSSSGDVSLDYDESGGDAGDAW